MGQTGLTQGQAGFPPTFGRDESHIQANFSSSGRCFT
jgi:hypothetical protein